MSSTIVITLALIGGVIWIGSILVASLRRRGSEEIPSNLAPGTTDDEMETRRLETGQKSAVLLSAFLAVSLPLYFLGEQDRQEGFVEQFNEESITRGEELIAEYACYSCHGPEGTGGSAPFVEKRSGVTVAWTAPSLNDVFFRYSEDEVNFWVTYGRGNTPMPAWGLPGGGPMNEQQVVDVVNYLKTIQIGQMEATGEIDPIVSAQATRLDEAETTVQSALVAQRQVLADIEQSTAQAPVISEIAARAREVLDNAGNGIDTDGDGLSDSAEAGVIALGEELVDFLRVIDPLSLDPENPESTEGVADLDAAQAVLSELSRLVDEGTEPGLVAQRNAIADALEGGTLAGGVLAPDAAASVDEMASAAADLGADVGGDDPEATVVAIEEAAAAEGASEDLVAMAGEIRSAFDGGLDPDGDGLSSSAEQTISAQVQAAIDATTPSPAVIANLDPTNEATSGEPDAEAAAIVVAGYEGLATNVSVTASNIEGIRATASGGVEYLEQALEESRWEIDIEGVAEAAFDGNTEEAARAVHLFNGYCARCHTAGFSAGVAFTLEAGAGGFGPALWDGRPLIQFGEPADELEDDLFYQFLLNGSESETPYGLNGFGSGRMPAFGQILTEDDLSLIIRYLRGGDLNGTSEVNR